MPELLGAPGAALLPNFGPLAPFPSPTIRLQLRSQAQPLESGAALWEPAPALPIEKKKRKEKKEAVLNSSWRKLGMEWKRSPIPPPLPQKKMQDSEEIM